MPDLTSRSLVTTVNDGDHMHKMENPGSTKDDKRIAMSTLRAYVNASPSPVTKTSDATLALSDQQDGLGIVEVSSGSTVAITVPPNSSVAFAVGTVFEIVRIGSGAVSVVAGSGVTFQPTGTASITSQYQSVFLRKRATDTWILS